MEFQQFSHLLRSGCEALGVHCDSSRDGDLYRYFQELKRWSSTINLISREARDEQIVENHFLDSLALLPVIEGGAGHHAPLLDVGSGAGFPGLVCKTARPDLKVSVLEPRLKRVSFLRHVVRTLQLENVLVEPRRLTADMQSPEGELGWVVSRAVANIGDFLQMCEPFRGCGCGIVCMKGPRCREELEAVDISAAGWSLTEHISYMLPFSKASRNIVVFRTLKRYTYYRYRYIKAGG